VLPWSSIGSLTYRKNVSFFLFGARGTDKSTLLRTAFGDRKIERFDLLLPKVEERFSRDPESLIAEIEALPGDIGVVALDEVQKVPKLLDVVHHLIEERKSEKQFVLTGASGRKLRRGGANLS
jgi:predicted AAA+ superfamily ATPase